MLSAVLMEATRKNGKRIMSVEQAISILRSKLRHLYLSSRRPARLDPEETFAYRSLWAVVVAGVILLITIESLDQDEFARRVDAVLAAIGAPHRPTATPDIVAALKQPNSK